MSLTCWHWSGAVLRLIIIQFTILSSISVSSSGDIPDFKGQFRHATVGQWSQFLVQTQCDEDHPFIASRAQCCLPNIHVNFTTPVRHELFLSNYHFHPRLLEHILKGGTLSLLGDSISTQIMNALVERCIASGYNSTEIEDPRPGATQVIDFWRIHARSNQRINAFRLELFRLFEVDDVKIIADKMMFQSSDQNNSIMQRQARPFEDSLHIVVCNIGLHYEGRDDALIQDLNDLGKIMSLFQAKDGNFAIMRETTPQHFKQASKSDEPGTYTQRDRSVQRCAPWLDHLSARSHRFNNYLIQAAATFNIQVQHVVQYLMDRFDAHVETRNDRKRNVLDCTHWCVSAMPVFEDTMLYAILKVTGINPNKIHLDHARVIQRG